MTPVEKEEIRAIIKKLLTDIEEEDIGISLFSTFYQNQDDLHFFKQEDREQVIGILKKLSEDSKRHKTILTEVIHHLEHKYHEK